MTNSINSDLFWARDVIEQAQRIIMNRFGLDAAQALEVLRKMSQKTRTQMCVVAEQLINNDVPLEALRGIEDVMYSAPADPSGELVVGSLVVSSLAQGSGLRAQAQGSRLPP